MYRLWFDSTLELCNYLDWINLLFCLFRVNRITVISIWKSFSDKLSDRFVLIKISSCLCANICERPTFGFCSFVHLCVCVCAGPIKCLSVKFNLWKEILFLVCDVSRTDIGRHKKLFNFWRKAEMDLGRFQASECVSVCVRPRVIGCLIKSNPAKEWYEWNGVLSLGGDDTRTINRQVALRMENDYMWSDNDSDGRSRNI